MTPEPFPRDTLPAGMTAHDVTAPVLNALDTLTIGFCLFDRDDCLTYANAAFRRIFEQPVEHAPPGMHASQMMAASVRHGLYAGRDAEAIWAERKAFLTREKTGVFLQTFADGRLIAISHHPQPDGGWAATYEDVTERRQSEILLRFMAHHDELTGLPNRYVLAERLDLALACLGDGRSCALFCLDLDGFKPVNDRLGHAAGDEILRQFGRRLSDEIGPEDTAARLGGDEFAILLVRTDAATAMRRAAEMFGRLTAPFQLGASGPIRIGTGLGIACAPSHASGARSLMERADQALYASKRLGRPILWHPGLEAPEAAGHLAWKRAAGGRERGA